MSLRVNGSLTLAGIPPAVFAYRRSDPNRADDSEYIVRLVGQVVRVSLETVKVVEALPEAYTM